MERNLILIHRATSFVKLDTGFVEEKLFGAKGTGEPFLLVLHVEMEFHLTSGRELFHTPGTLEPINACMWTLTRLRFKRGFI